MTDLEDFFHKPCEKLSAACVDAYTRLDYDETDDHNLVLDTSWGRSVIDMRPIVKASETVTSLELTETALQYNREDGEVDCIEGDDLSRIISFLKLKDVSTKAPANGNVYIYNSETGQMEPFDFNGWKSGVDGNSSSQAGDITNIYNELKETNEALVEQITQLNNQIVTLEKKLEQYQTTTDAHLSKIDGRLDTIEATIKKPTWAPSDAVLAWGNINDMYNSNPTGKGIFTHNPSTNVAGDQRFE